MRGALSEEDLVSKSLASEMTNSLLEARGNHNGDLNSIQSPLKNGAAYLPSAYSQESVFDNPAKLPSYIRVR